MASKITQLTLVLATLMAFTAMSEAAARERTFIMCKTDAVQRGLVGEVIKRYEAKGMKLVALKFLKATTEQLETHYSHLSGRSFFASLIDYMASGEFRCRWTFWIYLINFIISGPVVAMVWEGENSVKIARSLRGETNPANATVGTIRGDLAMNVGRNLVHSSSTVEEATREITLWFNEGEIVEWKKDSDVWIYE
jgi:nucleoside-diphosphate kinase